MIYYVLTPEEMRDADAAAGARIGREALMRNAGRAVAERVRKRVPPDGGRIVAFAGPGDNGGDAFATFAALESEYERIIYADPAPKTSPARKAAESAASAAGVRVEKLPENADESAAALRGADLAVDALFGTGSRLPLGDRYRAPAKALDARSLPVLAIDVPTGVDAATGAVDDAAVRATLTVTLGALKPGLLLMPAREHAGNSIYCEEIGITEEELAARARTFCALDGAELKRLIPRRAMESDKRRAGAPLVIAGSRQFPGAAVLCALGAARAGAGYVTVVTPSSTAHALRMHLIEQVVVEIDGAAPAQELIEEILDVSRRSSALAIGPGLALEERMGEVVRGVIAGTELPIVADASALFHLSKHLEELRGKRVVLTPHAGEFARLSGKGTIVTGERVSRLREFVARTGVTTLLKGLDTLVYAGAKMYINTTGTNALATAGTGDVLTGVIGTLLSQGLSPFDAACIGAYWHGLAGKHAARIRPRGVIARDVIDALAASDLSSRA